MSDHGRGRPTEETWAAAAELAPMVDVWRRLLEDHVPTTRGYCRACTQGGTGIPVERWPCGPRRIAETAARYSSGHDEGADGTPSATAS